MGKGKKGRDNFATESVASEDRLNGVVKWFNKDKGYGFITSIHGDVFVHYTGLEDNRKSLDEGEPVTFVVVQGIKGPAAQQVRADYA